MAARPSYVVKDANIKLTIPEGWSHTTIAVNLFPLHSQITISQLTLASRFPAENISISSPYTIVSTPSQRPSSEAAGIRLARL